MNEENQWLEIIVKLTPLIIFITGGMFTAASGLLINWYSKILKGQMVVFKDGTDLDYYKEGLIYLETESKKRISTSGYGMIVLGFSVLNNTSEECLVANIGLYANNNQIHYYMPHEGISIESPEIRGKRSYRQDIDPANLSFRVPAKSKKRISIIMFPQNKVNRNDSFMIKYITTEPTLFKKVKRRKIKVEVSNRE